MSVTVGRATLYELVMERGAGEPRYLLMYTNNRSRRILLESCRSHGETIAKLTNANRIVFAKKSGDGATVGGWRIHWSGRTQREAVRDPLPWIGDLA